MTYLLVGLYLVIVLPLIGVVAWLMVVEPLREIAAGVKCPPAREG